MQVLHPELRRQDNRGSEGSKGGDRNLAFKNFSTRWHPTNRRFTRNTNEKVTRDGMRLENEDQVIKNKKCRLILIKRG